MPRCTLNEFVKTVAIPVTLRQANDSDDRPWVWAPPRDTLDTLVVESLATRMLERAHHHINERAHGRESRFDAQLLEALAEGSERLREMRELVAEPNDHSALAEVPIDRAD